MPKVTLGFWIIKVIATTLGEIGGDAVTMTLGLGYLAGTAIFAALFAAAVAAQIAAQRFHTFLYWAVIVAATTAGTTLADFFDRSLGIGYVGGSSILFALLLATLGLWHRTLGSVSVDSVTTPRAENVLLGDDHVLADARHGAGRLPGRHRRAGIQRRRAGVRGGADSGGGAALLHEPERSA